MVQVGADLYRDLSEQYNLPFQVKSGAIYTGQSGLEKSVAVEVIQLPKGFSIDAGLTATQGFLGVSKDLVHRESLDIDLGCGITTKKDFYVGMHFKF